MLRPKTQSGLYAAAMSNTTPEAEQPPIPKENQFLLTLVADGFVTKATPPDGDES